MRRKRKQKTLRADLVPDAQGARALQNLVYVHIFMRRYRRKQKMMSVAMAKERPPALLVMAVANGIAMYVVVVVKSTHLQPTAPAPSSAVNEHQPSCFALEEERGEQWIGQRRRNKDGY